MDQDRHRPPVEPETLPIGSHPNAMTRDDTSEDRAVRNFDIIALVRSLQRTAGKRDCFKSGHADCDVMDCDWRAYCLAPPPIRPK
jgi:hypothetical protein